MVSHSPAKAGHTVMLRDNTELVHASNWTRGAPQKVVNIHVNRISQRPKEQDRYDNSFMVCSVRSPTLKSNM